MTPGRRPLRYESIDEIMPDVDRLLDGYTTVGKWSIGQMSRHLATIIRLSVDLPANPGQDPSKYLSPDQKRDFLENGVTPEGRPMPPGMEVPDSLDDREEAEGLRQAISHYQGSPDTVMDHPGLGPLTRAEWDRFHCHHCSHHFSFAVPC